MFTTQLTNLIYAFSSHAGRPPCPSSSQPIGLKRLVAILIEVQTGFESVKLQIDNL